MVLVYVVGGGSDPVKLESIDGVGKQVDHEGRLSLRVVEKKRGVTNKIIDTCVRLVYLAGHEADNGGCRWERRQCI
jgi:hypothetical protein